MGSNPAYNLKLFMLVLTFNLPLQQLSFPSCGDPTKCYFKNKTKSSKEQCSMFTDLSLQVALGRVPCSQTSLYRSPLWVRSYGQLQCLPTSLYRSPMASTKLADLSLQITPCKEDEKKKKKYLGTMFLSPQTYVKIRLADTM